MHKSDRIFDVSEEVFPAAGLSLTDVRATDAGNARRFAHQHASALQYVAATRHWRYWDGKRWAIDDGTEVMRRAKKTAISLYDEAARCPDSGRRMELARSAQRLESAMRLEAMVRLAQSEPGLTTIAAKFDADPMLLNVLNGVVELNTGALRSHDPAMLMTRLAPVDYLCDAECPQFLKFLNRIFSSNQNLIAFVQRALGYALTGLTSEQCMFLLHGTGANGKSTLIEIVRCLMGNYAVQSPSELLLTKRLADSGPSPQIVRLQGARFVTAVEADTGRTLAEAAVKQMTGQDTIAARDLHSSFVEFRPQFKLFMAVNHKPDVRGRDEGIWRRIKLIPFSVTIPEPERDRQLSEKLMGEAPGILNWIVRGCLAWQTSGLAVPREVEAATSGYREETDELAEFIDDRLIKDPAGFVSSDDLAREHLGWSQARCQDPLTSTKLGRAFGTRPGVAKIKKGGKRGFEGYRLSVDR